LVFFVKYWCRDPSKKKSEGRQVAYMGEMRNARTVSIGIHRGKDDIGQGVFGGRINIKTDSRHTRTRAGED
jgi:hypothetical protein